MKKVNPTGMENSIQGKMVPDIQAVLHVFAAHWRKVNSAWSYPEHTHPLFEFNVAWRGRQRMIVDGKTIVQEEGDILFIRPNIIHRSDGSEDGGDMTYFSLHFNIDDPAMRRSLLSVEEMIIPAGSAVSNTLFAIFKFYIEISNGLTNDQQGNIHLQENLLSLQASFRLFTSLCDWILNQKHELSDLRSDRSNPIAQAIERALRNSLDEARIIPEKRNGVEHIAVSLGYSPAYCNKVFKLAYGVSPRQYLSSLMIRQAKLLLMDGALSIEEIAYRFGYQDVSYFSKQFKRWTGISPLGYRKLSL